MKKFKHAALVFCLLSVILAGTVYSEDSLFSDVPSAHWAYPAIKTLVGTGVINGFPDRTFRPEDKVTREQFAVVSALALKLPLDKKAPQNFSDVKTDHWSFVYIDAAKSYIPTSYNPKGYFFNGGTPITREEAAVSLYLALDLENIPQADERFLAGSFSDYKSISPTYRTGVAIVVYSKMMSGNPNGTFEPKGGLTRAELSVLIDKLVKENRIKQVQTGGSEKPLKTGKPWTIQFNYKQPDVDLVKVFAGTVSEIVYGRPDESYLTLENTIISDGRATTKSVTMYVYEDDAVSFFIGDMLKVNYDRENNITSYSFEKEVQPHPYKPPVHR